jgi:UV DNA damage endonuclease
VCLRRLGYACLCLSVPGSSPRGARLRNATPDRLRELIAANLDGLQAVIRFNAAHAVRLFRISSDVIPFGSHPVNDLPWWDLFGDQLSVIGSLVRGADLRVSMHPGQYTLLSSPDPAVTRNAVLDLAYHARVLDALGLDATHKLVIHVGGAYGDPASALERWTRNVERLEPSIRARLVVENDERLFGARDVLRLSEVTGVPVVLDVLHERVFAGPAADAELPDLLRAAFRSWRTSDGVPKMHYASQSQGRRAGAHADYVDAAEFAAFLQHIAPAEQRFDCMLEAKAKDLALFTLRQELGLAA